jgi:hypothetical protein
MQPLTTTNQNKKMETNTNDKPNTPASGLHEPTCSAWISILKEMPDDWATVNLYSHQTEEVFSGYYSPEDGGENSFVAHHVNYGFSLETVTHWCPLPDPPAKEKCRNWMMQNLQSWPRKCPTCEHGPCLFISPNVKHIRR